MSQIIFDKLKENCVREFCSKNTRSQAGADCAAMKPAQAMLIRVKDYLETGKPVKQRKFMADLENELVAVIERTDIRNLKPLIELCPDSVPKWIKSGNYTLDLTDKGWAFFRN